MLPACLCQLSCGTEKKTQMVVRSFPKGVGHFGHSQGTVAQQRGWQCPAEPGSLGILCAWPCLAACPHKEIKAHTGLWQQAAMRESCFYIKTP